MYKSAHVSFEFSKFEVVCFLLRPFNTYPVLGDATVVGVGGCIGVAFSSSAILFLPSVVLGSLLLPIEPLPHQPEFDEPDEAPSRLTGRRVSPGGLLLRE